MHRLSGESRRRSGLSRRLARAAAGVGATLELTLFPSRCKVCRGWLETPGAKVVCGACLSALAPEPAPFCPCCGAFFDGAGEPHYCGACLETPPPFSRHRSLGRYRGALKEIVLLFKFRGYAVLGRALAEATCAALGREDGLWWGEPLLIPVPLHPRRERERGYNQCSLLALELAKRSGLEAADGILVRARNAPPQSTLEAAARARNIRGAFAVRRPARIRGRTVLLVDDVYTTGSTLKECAATLLKAGAAEVRGITLARA